MTNAMFEGNFPLLRNDALLLRELAPGDAAALYQQFSDPEVTRYYDLDPFTDPTQGEQLLALWRQRYERRFGVRWAICRTSEPEQLLGTCGYNLWVQASARAVLGFDLNRAHWRQGIMRQALGLVLDYGFDTMELNRAEAVVFRDNTASSGLLSDLGFTREGLLRQYEYLNGDFEDMYMYSLLRSDRAD